MEQVKAASKNFQLEFDKIVDEVTIKSLGMQKKAFQCCVSCFDLHKEDPKGVADCISGCHTNGQTFQNVLQREVDVIQSSIQSCQTVCANRFASMLDGAKDRSKIADVENRRGSCFEDCYKTSLPMIQEMKKRLLNKLNDLSH